MPVVVEANFRQPSTTSLAASSEPGSIAMMEVSGPSGEHRRPALEAHDHFADPAPTFGDSTFINGGSSASAHLLHPWNNGVVQDVSRSPSVGDTFVSAVASSDLPFPSSFSECTDDSESGPEDEEAHIPDEGISRTNYGYITTATITLSGSNSSLVPVDTLDSSIQNRTNGLSPSGGNDGRRPWIPPRPLEVGSSEMVLPGNIRSPGQEPSSSSGSTSISVSIGSVGEDSTQRELNEPHISVKIVPEKKGLFLKHSEYEVKLKGTEKPVRRRYKDFVTLHRYLAEKYPYRLIPTLPPKQLMLDSLLEERRRGLQTWLTIVSLHPVLGRSPIVSTFLRDTTTEHQYRLRVTYEKQMDELVRLRPDANLPDVDVDALAESRTRLRRVQCGIGRLKQLFDRRINQSQRQLGEATEIDSILQSPDLRDVFDERASFDDMSASQRQAAKQCERYARVHQRAVTERLDVLLAVLHAHGALCERVEKGIILDQQRVVAKASGGGLGNVRTKTKSASMHHSPVATSQDISVSATDIGLLPRRSAFAFSCAQAETLLAERYLQTLPSILLSHAHEEEQHHQKMSKIWHRLVVSESSRLC